MESKILKTLQEVKNSQKTIDNLLEINKFKLRHEDGEANTWQLQSLYQKEDCSLGFVYVDSVELGPCENHHHLDSKEYLIVVSGSVMLNINGVDVRILKVGDCGVVPKGAAHFSRPLENNTKLVYVCVPSDSGMSKLSASMEKI